MDSMTFSIRHFSNLHLAVLIWTILTGLVLCQNVDIDSYEFKLVPSIDEVVHFENDSYIVSCQANGTRLRWFDPNSEWVDSHRGRIHVEQRHNESVLIFSSISLADKGNWTCEAEKGHRKITFSMIVYKPITFVDTPVVQSVKENTEAFIKCMVTGDPMPDVSWYYNGQPLNTDNNERFRKNIDGLTIKRVARNDSGEYTCKAFQLTPILSNAKEQTIRLNILHKPIHANQYIRRESADLQYGYVKGHVNVTCEALAEPPATFQWFRNNKPIKQQQFINGEHVSFLPLYLNSSKQFGEYICEAKNELGMLKRTITLLNGTKPAAPPHIMLRGIASNMFDLDVGAKKTGKPDPMDITGYRFEILSKEDNRNNGGKWTNARVVIKGFADGVIYLIKDLTANTTYLIRVASFNAAGLSDWVGPEEFRTPEKAEHGTVSSAPRAQTPENGLQFFHFVLAAILGLCKFIFETLA